MSSKRISSHEEDNICELIRDLSLRTNVKKLTWALIERKSGFSRQALSANAEIKKAYSNAKGKTKAPLKSKDEIILDKSGRISKLEKEIEEKNKIIKDYEEKFVRWMENASEYLSVDQLDRPIQNSIKTENRLRAVK